MTQLRIAGIPVDVVFKDIKNIHLSVHPPTGRVRISAPHRTRLESIRLFAVSKVGWIKKNQSKLQRQEREPPRDYVERESHYVWGRRYLLRLSYATTRPEVNLSARALNMIVPRTASRETRATALDDWYRAELRQRAQPMIAKWEKRLGLPLTRFYVQRMRTKWGSSNPPRRTIRLNLDLVKLPPECLDYVILHEMAHFLAPRHDDHFRALLDRYMPGWRAVRDRLNEGPVPALE